MVQRIQKKILLTPVEPPSTSWLWLHDVNGSPSLDWYVNGKWSPIAGSVKQNAQSTPVNPTDNYVTNTALQVRLQSYATLSYLSNILTSYQPKLSVVPNSGITLSNNMLGLKLKAGDGIAINGNTISCTIQVPDPQNPDDPDPDAPDPLATLSEQVSALSSAVTALQDAGYVPGSWFKTINSTPIFDEEGGNITVSGGSGGGINVSVVQPGASTTDTGTLYFFSRSPYQNGGLYNILVQEGSLTYVDDNDVEHTHVYDPRNLYHLHSDGSFEVLTPKSGDITFQDNVVYYKGKRTTMLRYGELICTHKILYSTTADTAYFSFQIAGPFYNAVEINGEEVAQTPVTLRYDSTKVKVYEVIKTTVGNNTTWTETLRADGYVFTVGNNDFSIPRTLHFVRQGSDFSTHMNVAVRFVVGDPSGFHMDTDIHVKFPKAEILFKADPSKTLAQVNATRPAGVNEWDASYCSLDSNGRLRIANSGGKRRHEIKTMTIDQTKKRMFYSRVYGNDADTGLRLEVMWSNWTGYSTQQITNVDQLYWVSTQELNRVYGEFCLEVCEMLEVNHSFSNKYFHNTNANVDVIDVTLCVYQWNSTSGFLYDEIGVLEYDDAIFNVADEYPAIP